MKKAWAVLMSFLLLLSPFSLSGVRAEGEAPAASGQTSAPADEDYAAYLARHADAPRPEKEQRADLAQQETALAEYEGAQGLLLEENGTVRVRFTVNAAGLYAVRLGYVACRGAGSEVEFSFRLNGAYPFEAADKLAAT